MCGGICTVWIHEPGRNQVKSGEGCSKIPRLIAHRFVGSDKSKRGGGGIKKWTSNKCCKVGLGSDASSRAMCCPNPRRQKRTRRMPAAEWPASSYTVCWTWPVRDCLSCLRPLAKLEGIFPDIEDSKEGKRWNNAIGPRLKR